MAMFRNEGVLGFEAGGVAVIHSVFVTTGTTFRINGIFQDRVKFRFSDLSFPLFMSLPSRLQMIISPAFTASLFWGLETLVDCGLQELISTSAVAPVGVCEITPTAHVAWKNGN